MTFHAPQSLIDAATAYCERWYTFPEQDSYVIQSFHEVTDSASCAFILRWYKSFDGKTVKEHRVVLFTSSDGRKTWTDGHSIIAQLEH